MTFKIGIDVGGTFTDFLLMGPRGRTRAHKELSTPGDPSLAVMAGLAALAQGETMAFDRFVREVAIIVHGTTVTTNAVLTGNTARTGLITTRGFRDALQMRRGERTSTTVLNAGVGPILSRYLCKLVHQLEQARYRGTLLIMQSNGGVASPSGVARVAAMTLLSGPAAAPAAGLACMAAQRRKSFITVDMGGTSFDAALVRDGAPALTASGSVNRYALALPSMEINTIGAGGGSVAWIDDGGLLHMGPHSAGADPGPLCLDLVEAAQGMFHVINVNMASAIREISVHKGYDPREFPLICAGGAGPIHGAGIAGPVIIESVNTTIVVPAG